MSVTTLEEVFIRIADEEVSLEAHKRQEALVDGEGLLHDANEDKGTPSMLKKALNVLPFTGRTAAQRHAHTHVGHGGGHIRADVELVAIANNPAYSPNKGGLMTDVSVVPVASVGLSAGSQLDAQGKPVHTDGNRAHDGAHDGAHAGSPSGARGPSSANGVVSETSQYKSLNLFRQVVVLMRKRLIVFSRDQKGAFFQVGANRPRHCTH